MRKPHVQMPGQGWRAGAHLEWRHRWEVSSLCVAIKAMADCVGRM